MKTPRVPDRVKVTPLAPAGKAGPHLAASGGATGAATEMGTRSFPGALGQARALRAARWKLRLLWRDWLPGGQGQLSGWALGKTGRGRRAGG